jgi:PadR family transcriptional regulator PadR
MREFKKGSLSILVLRLLHEEPSYGYALCERLRERSSGVLHFEDAAIYPLLHGLERDGLVESYWDVGEGSSEPKGPRRKYYRLTPSGTTALFAALREWQEFTGAVDRVLGDIPAIQSEGKGS